MNIYLAGPLFTLAEREFNKALAKKLRDVLINKNVSHNIILPQNYAAEIAERPDFFNLMYNYCIERIDTSDVVLAILDGSDADSGTCIELGYALAKRKFIIGLRTDLRISEVKGLNLMVSNSCTKLIFIRKLKKVSIDLIVQKVVNLVLKNYRLIMQAN
ncbi:MAG TPA: nucleoside 2-deoxyribosyltransferase [archaeon]|nr:nucleoside 2-deoxyribosyltransferase [archaeon]